MGKASSGERLVRVESSHRALDRDGIRPDERPVAPTPSSSRSTRGSKSEVAAAAAAMIVDIEPIRMQARAVVAEEVPT
jgi:hypothetical protein